MIRAAVVYAFITVYILIMAPIGILWTYLTGRSTFIYRAARLCLRTAGVLCGVRVKITGRDKIVPGQTYVFLSNHQGNFDGPVLFHAIPRDMRALMKKEMLRMPVLSIVMQQLRFVPLDRSDPAGARDGIDRAAEILREGLSFIAFPEGTRSRDGRLGEFKKGAFIMAIKAGVPIVPITIVNSDRIQPPGAFGIKPGRIDLIIHQPIPTAGLTLDDRDHVISLTRKAIASAL